MSIGIVRPYVYMLGEKVHHNGCETKVVIRRNLMHIGCIDVTPDVLRHLLKEHDKAFSLHDDTIVLQEGKVNPEEKR